MAPASRRADQRPLSHEDRAVMTRRILLQGQDIAAAAAAALARRRRPQLPAHDHLPEFSVFGACRLCAGSATLAAVGAVARTRRPAGDRSRIRTALRWPHQHSRCRRTQFGSLSHGSKRATGDRDVLLPPKPRVLLLDEPLAGMAPEETDRMLCRCCSGLKPGHDPAGRSTTWSVFHIAGTASP